MKPIKDFLIETVILTAAVIGWGILRLIRTVQAYSKNDRNDGG